MFWDEGWGCFCGDWGEQMASCIANLLLIALFYKNIISINCYERRRGSFLLIFWWICYELWLFWSLLNIWGWNSLLLFYNFFLILTSRSGWCSEIAKLDAIGLHNKKEADFLPSIPNNILRQKQEEQIVDSKCNEENIPMKNSFNFKEI